MEAPKRLFGGNHKKELLKRVLTNLSEAKPSNERYLKEFKGALDIFVDNIEPFLKEYEELVSSYEDLIQVNIRNYQGLGLEKLKLREVKPHHSHEWGRYKVDYQTYLGGNSLEEMLASAHLGPLPQQFACSEFLIKRGLSSSIMMSTPNEMGCFLYNCNNKGNILDSSFERGKRVATQSPHCVIQMDSHDTGTILTMASSFIFFRGLTACLDRFTHQLKKVPVGSDKTLFDKTLIHLSSEFERVPTLEESGSDHNDHSHTSSFISGSIEGLQIIGNIKLNQGKMGTIGTAAHVSFLKRPIQARDIYHTICEALGVTCPLARSQSLVTWNKEKLVLKFNELKKVAEVG